MRIYLNAEAIHVLTVINMDLNAEDPLFLSPLIKQNKLDEARAAASVHLPKAPSLESYTGFLTVNQEYQSNLFFWFFPNVRSIFILFSLKIFQL